MEGIRRFGAAVALVACAVAGPAFGEEQKAPDEAAKGLSWPCFIDQIGVPVDLRTYEEFWIELKSQIPRDLIALLPERIMITDPHNSVTQVQSGTAQHAFVMQLAHSNIAIQHQFGSGSSAEAVQISSKTSALRSYSPSDGSGPILEAFAVGFHPVHLGIINNASEPDPDSSVAALAGNALEQLQSGSANSALAVQIGWGNTSIQSQEGAANISTIVQHGQDNGAILVQTTHQNTSTIVQHGSGSFASVRQ